jgi:hypothetical protein
MSLGRVSFEPQKRDTRWRYFLSVNKLDLGKEWSWGRIRAASANRTARDKESTVIRIVEGIMQGSVYPLGQKTVAESIHFLTSRVLGTGQASLSPNRPLSPISSTQ